MSSTGPKTISHNLTKHQIISMLYGIHKMSVENEVTFGSHKGRKFVNHQKAKFVVAGTYASTTTSLQFMYPDAWEFKSLTAHLDRGVLYTYSYGQPGSLALETCDPAIDIAKDAILDLSAFYYDVLKGEKPEAMLEGFEHLKECLSLPPVYALEGTTVHDQRLKSRSQNRALSGEESGAIAEVAKFAFDRLHGMPVRSSLIKILKEEFGIVNDGEVERLMKLEELALTKREAKVKTEGEKEDSTLNSYTPIVIEENAEGFLVCDGEVLSLDEMSPEVASGSVKTEVTGATAKTKVAASKSYVRRRH
jgi:hypothetical protein